MSLMENTAARLSAYALGRAVLTREAATISQDPDRTFGLVAIRLVTEDQVLLGFGCV
jgi:hypothetical protein